MALLEAHVVETGDALAILLEGLAVWIRASDKKTRYSYTLKIDVATKGDC